MIDKCIHRGLFDVNFVYPENYSIQKFPGNYSYSNSLPLTSENSNSSNSNGKKRKFRTLHQSNGKGKGKGKRKGKSPGRPPKLGVKSNNETTSSSPNDGGEIPDNKIINPNTRVVINQLNDVRHGQVGVVLSCNYLWYVVEFPDLKQVSYRKRNLDVIYQEASVHINDKEHANYTILCGKCNMVCNSNCDLDEGATFFPSPDLDNNLNNFQEPPECESLDQARTSVRLNGSNHHLETGSNDSGDHILTTSHHSSHINKNSNIEICDNDRGFSNYENGVTDQEIKFLDKSPRNPKILDSNSNSNIFPSLEPSCKSELAN